MVFRNKKKLKIKNVENRPVVGAVMLKLFNEDEVCWNRFYFCAFRGGRQANVANALPAASRDQTIYWNRWDVDDYFCFGCRWCELIHRHRQVVCTLIETAWLSKSTCFCSLRFEIIILLITSVNVITKTLLSLLNSIVSNWNVNRRTRRER